MFGDIGWAELLVIGVVALIVIGPEDLPEMFRQLGRFTAKIRSMAREFQRAMDQAARETGVNDLARDLKDATSPKSLGLTAVKDAADRFEKWDPLKPVKAAPKTVAPAPMAEPQPEPAAPAEGPATSALRQKQAQRKAILREATEKLKAVESPAPAETAPAAKPKVRIRTTKPADEAKAPTAPRTRKKKAPEA